MGDEPIRPCMGGWDMQAVRHRAAPSNVWRPIIVMFQMVRASWLMAQSGANRAPVDFPVLQGNYRDLAMVGSKSHTKNANTGGDSKS